MADEQDVKYEEVQNLNPQPSHVIVSQLAKVGVEIRELGWKLLAQLSALFVIYIHQYINICSLDTKIQNIMGIGWYIGHLFRWKHLVIQSFHWF